MYKKTNNTIMKFNTILAFAALISGGKGEAIETGEALLKSGADSLTDGGFWVWDIGTDIEFYSPNFRKVLGFDNEHDFPNNASSWQKQINQKDLQIALNNFYASEKDPAKAPYDQIVEYTTKQGEKIRVRCSGIIIETEGINKLLVGTHKIIS